LIGNNRPSLNYKADLYSLGLVLFFALNRRHAFSCDDNEVVRRKYHESEVREIREELNKTKRGTDLWRFHSCLLDMTLRDPSTRWSDPYELRSLFRDFARPKIYFQQIV